MGMGSENISVNQKSILSLATKDHANVTVRVLMKPHVPFSGAIIETYIWWSFLSLNPAPAQDKTHPCFSKYLQILLKTAGKLFVRLTKEGETLNVII